MDTYLYRAWTAAKQRCYNPKNKDYPRYGGRGIGMCQAWRESAEAFAEYVGPRPSSYHSLDRRDNSRGYEPGNVRWATPSQQARNNRMAKVSEDDVREILRLIHEEGLYHGGVAVAFGLSDSHTYALALGHRHHLPDYRYPTTLPKKPDDLRHRSYAERMKAATTL